MAAVSLRAVWQTLKRLAGDTPGQRKTSLPVAIIAPRPAPKAVLSPRQTRPEPWAELWQALDRQQEDFAELERKTAAAARQDGLDDDGPMTPTLAALRLSMRGLQANSRLIGHMLRHYMGQVLDALQNAKELSDAEAMRLRAGVQHAAADHYHRMQTATMPAKAASGSAALSGLAVLGLGCALTVVLVSMFAIGRWSGYDNGYSQGRAEAESSIRETEWRLKAAFAHGGLGASLWALLMEANDIESAIRGCERRHPIDTGGLRKACWVPLWTEPDTTLSAPEPAPAPVLAPQNPVTVDIPPPPPPKPRRQQHGSATPVQPFAPFGFTLLPTPPTGPLKIGPADSP